MINKRLINTVPKAMPHIIKNVVLKIFALISNIVLMFDIGLFLYALISGTVSSLGFVKYILVAIVCIMVRISSVYFANTEGYLASKFVKQVLRGKIYDKVVRLGNRYTDKISTAELLQISVEGVEQLETYFGSYLPQFFYSVIAPLILFITVSFIHFQIALMLFIGVAFIPISIVVVQKFAKKLLAKYWGEYTGLADNFLENLQGLNTLKIYSADDFKHKQMNNQAERFRIITMKVLSMQLNSIIVMDIVAYGGAALGIIASIMEFSKGEIGFMGCFVIIMLSADFFLPLRLLGSFFHIAMNGLAASKKIFALLDMEEKADSTQKIADTDIKIENLSYSYDNEKMTIRGIDLNISKNSFVSIVGNSGCGKSTIAEILSGVNENYSGNVKIGGIELSSIAKDNLADNITLITANSYIFKGTVRENLLMAKPDATKEELEKVLNAVNLSDFLKSENNLDTYLLERGSNFSGGQRQRLALARALLHDTEIYIFDEATSNIDMESEDEIMTVIKELAKSKTVVLISHRLINVIHSDVIYLLSKGEIAESGKHEELIFNNGLYSKLWSKQNELENFC